MSINRSISMANDAPDEVLIKAMKDPASSHIPQPIAYQELINRQRMRLAQKGGLGFANGGGVKGFAVGTPEGVALDPEWQTVTDDLEGTHGNYDMGGPTETGVRGRYQYSKRTYKKIAAKLGLDPNKWDKSTQDAVHAEYTRQNQRALAAAGVPINNTTTYLGHFLDGPVAAKFYKIVQANPGMDPKEALMRSGYSEKNAENTVNWNPRWFKGVNTAGDVVERIDHAAARAVRRANAAAQGVGAQIKDTAGNIVGDTMDSAAPYLGPVNKYVQGAGGVLQGVGNAAAGAIPAAIDAGADAYGAASPYLKQGWNGAVDAGADAYGAASPYMKPLNTTLTQAGGNALPPAPSAPSAPSPMAQIDPASLNKTGYGLGPKPAIFNAPPVAIPTAADIGAPPPAQTGVLPQTFGPKAPEPHGFAWDSFGGSIPSTPRQFLGFEKTPAPPPGPPQDPSKPRNYDDFLKATDDNMNTFRGVMGPLDYGDWAINNNDSGLTQIGKSAVQGVSELGHVIADVPAGLGYAGSVLGKAAIGGVMDVGDWLNYSKNERDKLTSNKLRGIGATPADNAAVKKLSDTSPAAKPATPAADPQKQFAPSPVAALTPRPEAQAAAAQDPQLASFYNDLKESKADLARQGGNNRAMSLLMAGLGIAGGKSQYFAENLAGAIPAIQNYQQGEREINMARHDIAKEGIAQKQLDRQITQQDVNVQLARDRMAMDKENQTRDNETALLGRYYRPSSVDELDRAAQRRASETGGSYDDAMSDIQSLDAVRRDQMLKLVEAQMAARAAGAPPPQIPNQLPLQGSTNQPYVLTPTK